MAQAKIDPHRELWRLLLRQIHGADYGWKGIAAKLRAEARHVAGFAMRGESFAITWDRGWWIIQAHRFHCPDKHHDIAPLLDELDKLTQDEAIQRAIDRVFAATD